MKSLEHNKLFTQLAPSEREKIQALYTKDVLDENNKYLAKVQKNMLMLQCIAMDMAELTVEQCLLVLANMREVYRQNSKILTDADQQAWLNAEMDRIFGVGGYPYKYIDKLEEM